MSNTTALKPVTTAELRAWFRADPKRMDALPPEARITVAKGARGLLHKGAIKVHDARRRNFAFDPNAVDPAKAARQAEREAARAQGFTVGSRGALSATVKAALAASV